MSDSGAPQSTRLWFGDDLEVVREPGSQDLSAGGPAHRVREHERGEDQRLYLVVQRGSGFRDEFPEADVLRRDGQFDLVLVPKDRSVPRIGSRYTARELLPAFEPQVIYEEPEAPPEEVDPWIVARLAEVTPACIEAHVRALSGFQTRLSWSPGFRKAAERAGGELKGAGATVTEQEFAVFDTKGGPSPKKLGDSFNLIADWLPDRKQRVYLTAHLDSVNDGDGPNDVTAPAPGANDNASGVAAILCVARIVGGLLRSGGVTSEHGLRVVLFGGEEQSRSGSIWHFQQLQLASNTASVFCVLNLDMIAYHAPGDAGAATNARVCGSDHYLRTRLARLGGVYTGLTMEASGELIHSDHISFKGRAAVCSTHKSKYDCCYHSKSDLPDGLDYSLVAEIARMNLAYLLVDIFTRAP